MMCLKTCNNQITISQSLTQSINAETKRPLTQSGWWLTSSEAV